MPVVLFVPSGFLQITVCSHTLTKPASALVARPSWRGMSAVCGWSSVQPGSTTSCLSITPELVPALGRC